MSLEFVSLLTSSFNDLSSWLIHDLQDLLECDVLVQCLALNMNNFSNGTTMGVILQGTN